MKKILCTFTFVILSLVTFSQSNILVESIEYDTYNPYNGRYEELRIEHPRNCYLTWSEEFRKVIIIGDDPHIFYITGLAEDAYSDRGYKVIQFTATDERGRNGVLISAISVSRNSGFIMMKYTGKAAIIYNF